MSECDVCNDEGGVYDIKSNSFTPCECLKIKKYKFQFEQSGLPLKYWDESIENYFKQQSRVVQQFLDSRKQLRRDHLIIKCNQFSSQSKFLYLSAKELIQANHRVKIISFNKLLLDISQSWKKNTDSDVFINQYKYSELFFIVDVDISLLRENMNQLVFIELFQWRENNRLSTIIGSNTDKQTFCDYFNLDVDCYAEYKLQSEK